MRDQVLTVPLAASTSLDGQDWRLIVAALLGIAAVVVLISVFKLQPFLALLLGAAVLAAVAGLAAADALASFSKGVGDTFGNVGLLVALGAMVGRLLVDSGGASRVVDAIVTKVSRGWLPWAMAGAAALIGLPMFFEIGLVLLIPIVLLVSRRSKTPVLAVGIPALAGLSVLHGLVPPHPGPLVAVAALKADLGLTLAFGLIVAIPTVIIAGPLFARFISPYGPQAAPATSAGGVVGAEDDVEDGGDGQGGRGARTGTLRRARPVGGGGDRGGGGDSGDDDRGADRGLGSGGTDSGLDESREASREAPEGVAEGTGGVATRTRPTGQRRSPSVAAAVATVLLPVVLMLARAVGELTLDEDNRVRKILDVIGTPTLALLVGVIFAIFALGVAVGTDRQGISHILEASLPPMAGTLLIIAAGGGFKQTLVDSGVGKLIGELAEGANLSPLLLGWLVAVGIRLATGSATVATITAAGIVAPLVSDLDTPTVSLVVLAIGAGSLFFSHVNDVGFWLVKQYFGMTVGQTLMSWSVMETIISVCGLVFVLLLSLVV